MNFFFVNSFTKYLVVRRTTWPQFLVVLTYFLVAVDTRTLEFCYPVIIAVAVTPHTSPRLTHVHKINALFRTLVRVT